MCESLPMSTNTGTGIGSTQIAHGQRVQSFFNPILMIFDQNATILRFRKNKR